MIKIWSCSAALGLSVAVTAMFAQAPATTPATNPSQPKLAAMSTAMHKNEEQLHTYQWTESVALTMNGKPLPPKQSLCRYAADGTVLKTPLGPAPAMQGGRRGGPLMRKLAENKKEQVEGELKQIQEVTKQYLPFNPQRLKEAFASAGNVDVQTGSPAAVVIVIKGYAKPADELRLTLGRTTMMIDAIAIKTYLDKPKNTATIDVHFAQLADGTLYPAMTMMRAPEKNIALDITNSNYLHAMD